MPKRIGRRTFLRASAAVAVAGVAYGANLRLPLAQHSARSSPRKVLTQELRLGPSELRAGALSGLANVPGGLTLRVGSTAGEYVSPVLKSDLPFHFAGVHWSGLNHERSETPFWLRTSADGKTWSDWVPVHVDLPPGPRAEDDNYGSLIWAAGHNYAQVKATIRGAENEAVLSRVGVTLLNPYDGPPVETTPTPEVATPDTAEAAEMDLSANSAAPQPALAKPLTFSREAWGCDESLRFSNGQEIWPRSYVPVKKLVVHHTATGNGYYGVGDAMAHVRSVYTYHTVSQGWGDIGYNCLVDKWGNSYEGRRGREGPGYDGPGGREIMSADVVAGHALVYNYGSAGIALLGDFTATTPPGAMISRLEEVLAFECARRGIRGDSASDFLIHDSTWHRGLPHIVGHRDVGQTGCPGGFVYARLPQIRNNVIARTADASAPQVVITSAPPQDTVHSNKVQFSWGGWGGSGALEYSYYLEGWLRAPEGDVIYIRGFTGERSPAWSPWAATTSAEFYLAAAGFYTFHIMVRDSSGRVGVYQDTRTFLGHPQGGVSDGALLAGTGPHVYLVQGGTKRHIPNAATFLSRGFWWGDINYLADAALNSFPSGRPLLDVLADGNLIRGSGPEVYVMEAGTKRHVAGPQVMTDCGYGWDAIQPVPDSIVASIPTGTTLYGPPCPHLSPPDSALLIANGPAVYLMQRGLKRHVPNLPTFEAMALRWSNLDRIPESSLEGIPTGRPLLNVLADGNLLRSTAAVYVMEGGLKRHVQDPSVMDSCGYGWDAVYQVTDASLAPLPTGGTLTGPPCPMLRPPEGELIKGSGPAVYVMDSSRKRHVTNLGVFDACYQWGNVNPIPDSSLANIPSGPTLTNPPCP